MRFDIILKNNATGKYTVVMNQIDASPTELYLQFDNVDLSNLENGEYTYVAVQDNNGSNQYNLVPDTLESKVTIGTNVVTLRSLNPFIGLMKIDSEEKEETPVYNNDNTNYYYEG